MFRHHVGVWLVVSCAVVSAAAGELRVWQSADGQHKTEAELVEAREKSVLLKKADGKTVEVPLEKLSAADREYAERQRQASVPAAVPAPRQDAPAAQAPAPSTAVPAAAASPAEAAAPDAETENKNQPPLAELAKALLDEAKALLDKKRRLPREDPDPQLTDYQTKETKPQSVWLELLRTADLNHQRAAIRAGQSSDVILQEAINSNKAALQFQVIHTLQQASPTPERLDLLMSMATSPEPEVRAKVLGLLPGLGNSALKKIVLLEIRGLNDPSEKVQTEAVRWFDRVKMYRNLPPDWVPGGSNRGDLGPLAPEIVSGDLIQALSSSNEQVVLAAANAFVAFDVKYPDAAPALLKILQSPKAPLKAAAAVALWKAAGRKDGAPLLIEAIKNSHLGQDDREYYSALGSMGPGASDVVDDLVAMVHEETTVGLQPVGTCVEVLRALKELGPNAKSAVPALSDKLRNLGDPLYPIPRVELIQTLGAMGPDAVPVLVEALKKDENQERVWSTALFPLIRLGSQARSAHDELLQLYEKTPHESHKVLLALGLWRIDGDPARLTFLQDEIAKSGENQQSLLYGLHECQPLPDATIPLLIGMVRHALPQPPGTLSPEVNPVAMLNSLDPAKVIPLVVEDLRAHGRQMTFIGLLAKHGKNSAAAAPLIREYLLQGKFSPPHEQMAMAQALWKISKDSLTLEIYIKLRKSNSEGPNEVLNPQFDPLNTQVTWFFKSLSKAPDEPIAQVIELAATGKVDYESARQAIIEMAALPDDVKQAVLEKFSSAGGAENAAKPTNAVSMSSPSATAPQAKSGSDTSTPSADREPFAVAANKLIEASRNRPNPPKKPRSFSEHERQESQALYNPSLNRFMAADATHRAAALIELSKALQSRSPLFISDSLAQAIQTAAKDEDPKIRVEAVKVLARIARIHEGSKDAFRATFDDRDPLVRCQAIELIFNELPQCSSLGSQQELVSLLQHRVRDPVPEVRYAALRAFFIMAERTRQICRDIPLIQEAKLDEMSAWLEPIIPDLVRALSDPDPKMVSLALVNLRNCRGRFHMNTIEPQLLAALENDDPGLCATAAGCLWSCMHRADGLPALIKNLQSENPAIAIGAAYSLKVMGPAAKAAIPQLTENLRKTNNGVWQSAAETLAAIKGEAISALIAGISEKSGFDREIILREFDTLAPDVADEIREPFQKFFESFDGADKVHVAAILAGIDQDPRWVAFLFESAASPDDRLREMASRGLRRLSNPSDEVIVKMVAFMRAPSKGGVKNGISFALINLGSKVVPLLVEDLRTHGPDQGFVRMLREIGDPSAASALRDALPKAVGIPERRILVEACWACGKNSDAMQEVVRFYRHVYAAPQNPREARDSLEDTPDKVFAGLCSYLARDADAAVEALAKLEAEGSVDYPTAWKIVEAIALRVPRNPT